MAASYLIGKFVPPRFERAPLDLSTLERSFGHALSYAANGRSALYRILAGRARTTRILLPAYLCATVLIPLEKLGITPVYYDLDPADLNPSLASMLSMAEQQGVDVALFPSLYGNAADLAAAEASAKDKGIFLIDDAAQSLGASLDGRPVGSFGDAGFFSFSPGKPLAGHMGAFCWSGDPLAPTHARHDLIHRIKWIDYRFRRYNAYETQDIPLLHKVMELGTILITKLSDESLDQIAPFEVEILGGLIRALEEGAFVFRQRQADAFARRFGAAERFRVVTALRGTPCNHKIVLHFASREQASGFRGFMQKRKIYAGAGYPLLTANLADLPHAASIEDCIVELPIEDDVVKMEYMFDVVQSYVDHRQA